MLLLFKIFLYLLRPSDAKLKMRKPGRVLRWRISLYRAVLRRLLWTYRYYAVYDVVAVDKGMVKVVHECRDYGFERELARNKMALDKSLGDKEFPFSVERTGSRWLAGYFKFEDTVKVYVNGKELQIRHDDHFSVDGNVNASATCYDVMNLIQGADVKIMAGLGIVKGGAAAQRRKKQTVFEGEAVPGMDDDNQNPQQPERPGKQPIMPTSFFGGEQIPKRDPDPTPAPMPAPETTKVRGIEIDNDF